MENKQRVISLREHYFHPSTDDQEVIEIPRYESGSIVIEKAEIVVVEWDRYPDDTFMYYRHEMGKMIELVARTCIR